MEDNEVFGGFDDFEDFSLESTTKEEAIEKEDPLLEDKPLAKIKETEEESPHEEDEEDYSEEDEGAEDEDAPLDKRIVSVGEILEQTEYSLFDRIHYIFERNQFISQIKFSCPNYFHYKDDGRPVTVKYDSSFEEMIEFARDVKYNNKEKDYDDKMLYFAENQIRMEDETRARVHIFLPPVTQYPAVTIARKVGHLRTLEALQKKGMFTKEVHSFLQELIRTKQTIVVSGGSGAGKTNLLEALLLEVSAHDSLLFAEDVPELETNHRNVTYARSVPLRPGMDAKEEVTLQTLVKEFNRARGDRFIIGEVRGAEFGEFIVASNSGVRGCLSSLHGNSPNMALKKMTKFAMDATPGSSARSANASIITAVDFIIQLGKNSRGEHRVLEIASVDEQLGEDSDATMTSTPVYKYVEDNNSWDYYALSVVANRKLGEYNSDWVGKPTKTSSQPTVPGSVWH